jgi:hypothetical protein
LQEFIEACKQGLIQVVNSLLKDKKVDPAAQNNVGNDISMAFLINQPFAGQQEMVTQKLLVL